MQRIQPLPPLPLPPPPRAFLNTLTPRIRFSLPNEVTTIFRGLQIIETKDNENYIKGLMSWILKYK